jgi:peptidoglycan/xylan/chitin deacetylase (PgdA/CDA1 family)
VLKANGINASFGITGVWDQANPDLIKRKVDEGHHIMNHTWNHPSFTGYSALPALTSAPARKLGLTRTADYIYQLTGHRTSRPTGGHRTAAATGRCARMPTMPATGKQ